MILVSYRSLNSYGFDSITFATTHDKTVAEMFQRGEYSERELLLYSDSVVRYNVTWKSFACMKSRYGYNAGEIVFKYLGIMVNEDFEIGTKQDLSWFLLKYDTSSVQILDIPDET